MKRFLNIASLILAFTFIISCTDLDVTPIDDDEVTALDFFDSPEAYKQVLAKMYGGLMLTGNTGPAGSGDVQGINEGFSSYTRVLIYLQEFSSDTWLVGGFSDAGIEDFQYHAWSSNNGFVDGFYSRIYYNVTLANEFIRLTNGSSDEVLQGYNREARFLRALAYWHALDHYRNVPLITEDDGLGSFLPTQVNAQTMFDYIESELLDILPDMAETGSADYYARADKGAVRFLLAKLYLNSEVYTGTAKWNEVVTYTDAIVNDASYSLESNYDYNFLADNHLSNEIVFTVYCDGKLSQSYGACAMLVNAGVGGDMTSSNYGISGGWGGTRTTGQFVDKFEDDVAAMEAGTFLEANAVDARANFWVGGQQKEIEEVGTFKHGFAYTKFKNLTRAGAQGSDGQFPDIDFPMFRLADAYLMYAEAVERGATNGSSATALQLVNDLRERAYGDASGNITSNDLTLDFLIDERGRELYLEGHRRTDLIRFGKFTGGDYLWAWKGGIQAGASTASYLNIFPIPSSDLTANPNLEQNTGY